MSQVTITPQKALIGGLSAAVVGLGIALGVTLPAPSCLPDPASQIAQGGVFNGQGNCYTTNGISVPSGTTVENATFNDPTVTPPAKGGVLPIVRVKDANDVTVSNLTLNGQNVNGGRNITLVGEAGVSVESSTNVSLDGIAVNHVFGDGLTLGAFQPRHGPSSSVSVNGYTVNGNGAARQGMTVSYVNGATVNNLTTIGSGIDFESDVGVGSGNVTVSSFTGTNVRMIEALTGPVTFNNTTSGQVTLINQAGASMQPVTFTGGTLTIKRGFTGIPPAGIWVQAGNLTLNNMTVNRKPGVDAITGPAWNVTNGGHLTLVHCTVTPPLGSNDSTSVVTISP